jgi:hypothetical protein
VDWFLSIIFLSDSFQVQFSMLEQNPIRHCKHLFLVLFPTSYQCVLRWLYLFICLFSAESRLKWNGKQSCEIYEEVTSLFKKTVIHSDSSINWFPGIQVREVLILCCRYSEQYWYYALVLYEFLICLTEVYGFHVFCVSNLHLQASDLFRHYHSCLTVTLLLLGILRMDSYLGWLYQSFLLH